jgi:hypothetical protein
MLKTIMSALGLVTGRTQSEHNESFQGDSDQKAVWPGDLLQPVLAKGERKNLHARTEKLDLELAVGDGLRLPDQLIQTLFAHRAVALFVNVNAVSRARRVPIDQHTKSH